MKRKTSRWLLAWMLLPAISVLLVSTSIVGAKDLVPESRASTGDSIIIDNSYVSVPAQLVSAIAVALEEKPAELLEGTQLALTSARIEGEWALVSIASLNGPNSDMHYVGGGDSGGLAIAVRNHDGSWRVALQGTDEFSVLLNRTPDRFISPDAKVLLIPEPTSVDAPSSVEYKFPWATGLSWTWTQGWHSGGHHDMGTSGSDKRLLAAAGGVVTYICWGTLSVNVQIQDADGIVMGYSHIDRNTLESCVSEGTVIPRGQVLGSLRPDTWSDGCGYTNQNPWFAHVHWGIPTDRAVTVDGWTIQYPNNYWEKNGAYTYVGGTLPSTNQPVYGCPSCCCSSVQSQSMCGGSQSYEDEPLEFPTNLDWDADVKTDSSQETIAEAENPIEPVIDIPEPAEPKFEAKPSPVSVQRAPIESQRTPPTSTNYRIPKSVFGSGGGEKTSTHYVLNSTQGQSTDLSRRESASYVLSPGYWSSTAMGGYTVYLPLVVKGR